MLRLFTPIILLQCFCVYHAYKNDKDRIWYFIIILLPVVGCLIYIFDNFNSPKSIVDIANDLKSAVNTNHRAQRLEKAIQFSDTIINKTALADEYVKLKRYEEAIELYQNCLAGYNADDVEILMKLLKAEYLNNNFKKVIQYGAQLEGQSLFKNADENVFYALSLHNENETEAAIKVFESMDVAFGNYTQRLAYYEMLIKEDREEVKEKLAQMMEEFDQMDRLERRNNDVIFGRLKKLYQSIGE